MFAKVLSQTSAKLEAAGGGALGMTMIMAPPKMGAPAMTVVLGVYMFSYSCSSCDSPLYSNRETTR